MVFEVSQHTETESWQSIIAVLGILWLQFVREPGTFTGKVARVNEPVGKRKRHKIAQLGTELQKTPISPVVAALSGLFF